MTNADLRNKGFIEMPDGSFSKPLMAGANLPNTKTIVLKESLLKGDSSGNSLTPANLLDDGKFLHAEKSFVIKTQPVPAPRMTRRDKWLKPRRPCVQRYFDYRDLVRSVVGDLGSVPDHITEVFYLAMPVSWSKKKQKLMEGQPHRPKPDRDNLDKAICDSLFEDDSSVWSGEQRKFWCYDGQERVELTMKWTGEIRE